MRFCSFLFLLLLATWLCCGSYSYAQSNTNHNDSLLQRVSSMSSQENRVDVLLKVVEGLPCSDSIRRQAYIIQALAWAGEVNYNKGLIAGNYQAGKIYERCNNNYEKAINSYNKCLAIAKKRTSTGQAFAACNSIADCYTRLADYSNALKYYKLILDMPLGRDTVIQVLGNAGITYQSMGDNTSALAQYQKAYNMLYKDMSAMPTDMDSLNLMGLKFQIANIYLAIPDYNRAMENYLEVARWNKSVQYEWFDVLANMGVADCYLKQGDYALALQYYHLARAVLQAMPPSVNRREKLSLTYDRLGETHLLSGNKDSAYYFIKNSLTLAEGSGDKTEITAQLPRTYLTMAKLLIDRRQYHKAITYLNRSVSYAQSAGAVEVCSDAELVLSNAYEKTGNDKAALTAYREHIKLKDSLYSRSKMSQLTRIDMQGYFDRKQLDDSLKLAAERVEAGYKLQRQRLLTYSGFGGIALIMLLMFFVFRNYKNEKRANKVISESSAAIQKEKKVSDDLLLNILPEEVAEELKLKGSVDARQYDNVSVLFTDFVNFTQAGERLTPQQLVAELHTCFKAFDAIMDKYNIEKIKTIGDAYMAVSGLPVADANHAVNIVKAAIDISKYIQQRRERLGADAFDIRLGISSGSLVAGIVGVKKFAYDIWGDTVNTAARMEQSGAPGRINVSQHTYELIKEHFTCEYRGEIPAKNKGNMKMYFVQEG